MKRDVLAIYAVPLVLLFVVLGCVAFGGPEPGLHGRQSWTISLGSSFMAGSPTFDTWLQWNVIPRAFALRVSSSVLQVLPGSGTFAFSLSALGTPYIGDFGLYLGIGTGATLTVAGGSAAGTFMTDALAGMTIPIADIIGFYMQIRLLGIISGGTFNAIILPGLGFYILF